MPAVPFQESIILNATNTVDLTPFDRFGGRGGRVAVKATSIAAESGDVNLTLIVGSDVIVNASPVFGESTVGAGPTGETPSYSAIGAPGDPITLRLANTTGATIVIQGVVQIDNA